MPRFYKKASAFGRTTVVLMGCRRNQTRRRSVGSRYHADSPDTELRKPIAGVVMRQ